MTPLIITQLNFRYPTWFFLFRIGLDDLRDWTNNVQPSIPIYVAKRDFEVYSHILHFLHLFFHEKLLLENWNYVLKSHSWRNMKDLLLVFAVRYMMMS